MRKFDKRKLGIRSMEITLEQARALDCVARFGSFTKAATHLRKGHTGVIYLLKTLETRIGLTLLDRSNYRTELTPTGKLIWMECQKMLTTEKQLLNLCNEISSGWEPYLTVVFDGLIPVEEGIKVLACLEKRHVPTRVSLFTEFLSGVEKKFLKENADLMLSVIPPQEMVLESVHLPPIRARLVAHRDHCLGKTRKPITEEQLQKHLLLTVRGSDERLNMSTTALDKTSTVHLSDFYAKKVAIIQGLGYGWLPDYLIKKELKAGVLKAVRWEKASEHVYHPKLYHRGKHQLGRAGQLFLTEVLARIGAKEEPSTLTAKKWP